MNCSGFPCFDEPALKATFALKMVHDQHYDVFSNADQQTKAIYNRDGLMITAFDSSVKMSTYLVAFIVCDFKILSDRTKDGIHVRVIVPRGKVSAWCSPVYSRRIQFDVSKLQTNRLTDCASRCIIADQYARAEYALKTATAILSYFQDFFNITYPLTKLDLVAVPGKSFAACNLLNDANSFDLVLSHSFYRLPSRCNGGRNFFQIRCFFQSFYAFASFRMRKESASAF